jgi:VWFA-related protein
LWAYCRFRPRRLPAILVAAWCLSTPFAPAAQQQAGFEARVERVRIDIIVTNEAGGFVDDLALHELAIFEDGTPQEILEVQLVDLAAGTIAPLSSQSIPGSEGQNAAAAGDTASVADQGPSLDSLGAIAFAIDVRSLGYWERRRFANGWLSFLEQSGPFTFPRSVYLISSELRELAPLTRDRDVLRQVAAELRAATYLAEEGALGGVFGQDHAQMPTRSSQQTLRELVSVVDALSARRGRKALVWVSPGVATSMAHEGFSSQDAGARDAVERLVHAANAAGVSIYGLDPTLVTKRDQYRPWTRITSREGPAEAIRRDPLGRRVWYFDSLRDSLFAVSRQTGGRAYPFRVAVEETLFEIERDTSRFYLLAYAPPPPIGDGEYHDIEVRVARDDVDVRARAGYVDGAGGQ